MRKPLSKKIKERIYLKFDGHCAYCGEKPEKLCIDHLHPVASAHRFVGDINDEINLMPACFSCNNYKTSLDLETFRQELSQQVIRARRGSVNFRLAERFGLLAINDRKIVFYFEKFN